MRSVVRVKSIAEGFIIIKISQKVVIDHRETLPSLPVPKTVLVVERAVVPLCLQLMCSGCFAN